MGNIPTKNKAIAMLEEAERLNPGPWVQHSRYVGEAAALIAGHCDGMDAEKAYVLGLLHDIGRRVGKTNMRHILDGYTYAMENGYPEVGKICITHSFPVGNTHEAFGVWDCSEQEFLFVQEFLRSTEYDDYDRLMQLCDAVALPVGFVLMEKRMVDVALRHGTHADIVGKWKATFQIKDAFEIRMGRSIYSLFPHVVENTFGMSHGDAFSTSLSV
jgi:hypothetical protein